MDENGRKRNLKAEATRWLIFFGVAIVLSVLLWLGLSLTGRKNPITSFGTLVSDSSVTVGIEGNAPKSLDIRTEQGTAVEQALLGNVYETLVSRSETNKLQPGIASSWQASDDGLTYTFTLNGGMTFANGHKLDSSDVVWSLQNAVNNHYVGADQLGDLKEITNPNANTVVITLAKPNPRLLARAGRPCRRRVRRGKQNQLCEIGGRIGTIHRVNRGPIANRAATQRLVLGAKKPHHRK